MDYRIAAITHQGTGEHNQDNFYCNGIYKRSITVNEFEIEMKASCKDINVFAVFDGVGGLCDGSSAALAACEALYNTCRKNPTDIGVAIMDADQLVTSAGIHAGQRMGSTCVIVEEHAGRFRSWNVGDSRSYYFHSGEMLQISKDHTEAENARAIQGITGESFHIPERYEHTLTQYLGADKSIYTAEPYISAWIKRSDGDKLLLCSDGLYNSVESTKITEIITRDTATLDKCKDLIKEALARGGKDNITVVLIEDEH